MALQYPNMREELRAYLRELADAAYQRANWAREPNFDEVVHFLFDDTDLSRDARESIGVFLRDATEAEAVMQVTRAIEAVLTRHGNDLADREYIQVPEWPAVVDAARRAHELLVAND